MEWSTCPVLSRKRTGFWLEYPGLRDTRLELLHWSPPAGRRARTMEQLLAPSAVPENQASSSSPDGSSSRKEAWLAAAGGNRYASYRPSAVFLTFPTGRERLIITPTFSYFSPSKTGWNSELASEATARQRKTELSIFFAIALHARPHSVLQGVARNRIFRSRIPRGGWVQDVGQERCKFLTVSTRIFLGVSRGEEVVRPQLIAAVICVPSD